jgi:outer membrane protein W
VIACLAASGAHAADAGQSAPLVTPPPPAPTTSPLSATIGDNSFVSTSAALNAAVRLSNPQGGGYAMNGPALDLSKPPPPSVTVRYRLMPNAAFSPYIGGSLITADALAGVNRGGVSLNLRGGASVAMGFDTDRNGQAKVKFDVGLQQSLIAAPAFDHKTYNPMIVGAGMGLKF